MTELVRTDGGKQDHSDIGIGSKQYFSHAITQGQPLPTFLDPFV
mgnify:FL=1